MKGNSENQNARIGLNTTDREQRCSNECRSDLVPPAVVMSSLRRRLHSWAVTGAVRHRQRERRSRDRRVDLHLVTTAAGSGFNAVRWSIRTQIL